MSNKILSSHHNRLLKAFFKDFEWIHITLGLLGNLTFLIGSILFLYDSLKTEGTWLFIIGALFMLIGSIGNGLVKYVYRHHRHD